MSEHVQPRAAASRRVPRHLSITAIAFEAHGPTARRVREAIVQQRVRVSDEPDRASSRGW